MLRDNPKCKSSPYRLNSSTKTRFVILISVNYFKDKETALTVIGHVLVQIKNY